MHKYGWAGALPMRCPIRVCVDRMFLAFFREREVDRRLSPRRLLARFMLSLGLGADCHVQTATDFLRELQCPSSRQF